MTKFICISGKAQHGKDTSAQMFYDQFVALNKKVLTVHYADLLKFICKSYFGWDGKKDEAGRTLLQRVGTDVVRKQEPDYWVNFVVSIVQLFPDEWEYIIIPDCRFPNEIETLKMAGFDVAHVRVVRPDFDNGLTKEQQSHISETALDEYKADYVLTNKGLHDLYQSVQATIQIMNGKGVD